MKNNNAMVFRLQLVLPTLFINFVTGTWAILNPAKQYELVETNSVHIATFPVFWPYTELPSRCTAVMLILLNTKHYKF